MKKIIKKVLSEKLRRKVLDFLNHLWVFICSHLRLKKRVLFYTVRENGALLENARAVYDALDTPKGVFAAKLPHTKLQKAKAYYLLLTNKVIVTDDYCRYLPYIKLRSGQSVVQIWHACGAFKKFGLDDTLSRFTPESERAFHSKYTFAVVTSEECRGIYAGAFGIDTNKCLPLGLPRTDRLVNDKENIKKEFIDRHPALKNKKIYLYAPTFREKDGEKRVFDPGIDFDALSEELNEDEIFIVCRHPVMEYNILKKKYNNIIDLTGESVLRVLSISAALVTDYSSIVFDSSLMGVPCVFYCPDIEIYERGFYLKFPDDLPGKMITSPGEILREARKAAENPDTEKISVFIKKYLSSCDGAASKRVAGEIKKLWTLS
ncbi:MAG: CDP-glycerol glycerophosphotransferase family protein [Clostridiales bacterium]|nr:CDP-glycerol glycerophosphotransferase family protein [Clostridiales bacterium]